MSLRGALGGAGLVGCLGVLGCSSYTGHAALTPPLDSLVASAAIDTAIGHVWADTIPGHAEGDIYQRWMGYLAEGVGNPGRACRPSSEYWLKSEQEQALCYSLALLYTPLSATAQVLSIRRDAGLPNTYRVLTLLRSDSARSPLRSGIALMTVFALPSDSTWVFANTLPRYTADWRRVTIGPLTYVVAPSYRFQRERAEAAVRLVDSLTTVLGVPSIDPLTYYLLPTIDDVYRIMGLQTPIAWGPRGGVAQPMNHQLFSGDPSIGENYAHELAHVVLRPLAGSPLTFVAEGVPTWLGGTSGMDYHRAADSLATFLRATPGVTLDSLIDSRRWGINSYSAGAVLVEMIAAQGGINAVKTFYGSSSDSAGMRRDLEHLFQQPWSAIAASWRARVLAAAP